MTERVKIKSVRNMHARWLRDERALEAMFTAAEEYSDGMEMLRNLGSAIAYAARFINKRTHGEEACRSEK